VGELISTARQWPQAIEPYRRTIELDPNVALVHDNLGIALKEIGDHDQAIEEYVKARSVSGDDNFRPEALRSASQKHGMRGFREKQPQFALEHWTGMAHTCFSDRIALRKIRRSRFGDGVATKGR
jgi:tetratricopeptide (TPR) repeat protein